MKEAIVGDKIGGRINNHNMERFSNDMAIIAKTKEELQDTLNRLVDTRRKYNIGINIDKSQIMRNEK